MEIQETLTRIQENLGENFRSRTAILVTGLLVITAAFLIFNYYEKTGDREISQAEEKVTSEEGLEAEGVENLGEILGEQSEEGLYTVEEGDTLWSIAEEKLDNPYRWMEIAELNELQKNSLGFYDLTEGQTLNLPSTEGEEETVIVGDAEEEGEIKATSIERGEEESGEEEGVEEAQETETPEEAETTEEETEITEEEIETAEEIEMLSETAIGDSPAIYTVERGDTLWGIAEEIYGDGTKWYLIFDSNDLGRLPNGSPLIHRGNQLVCPAL